MKMYAKRWASIILLAVIAIFTAPVMWASDSPPAASPGESITVETGKWSPLIIVLAPLIVSTLKTIGPKFIEKIPKIWMPIAVAAIGLLLSFVDAFGGGAGLSPVVGAVLGAAGLWLREFLDQLKKAGGKAAVPLLIFGTMLLIGAGCASNPLVAAQQIETGANDTLNTFVRLEYKNRAYIKKHMPAVSAFADKLVAKVEITYRGEKMVVPWGKAIIFSLNEARRSAKEAYLAAEQVPTPGNQEKAKASNAGLQAALAAVKQLIDEANEHIFAMQKIK